MIALYTQLMHSNLHIQLVWGGRKDNGVGEFEGKQKCIHTRTHAHAHTRTHTHTHTQEKDISLLMTTLQKQGNGVSE